MIDNPFPRHEEWDTRLLIAGSRDASPKMLDLARRAVERAKARKWTIIVGDAVGVDAAVTRAVLDISDDSLMLDGMPRLWCQVYGLTPTPRNGVVGQWMNYTRLTKYPDTQTVIKWLRAGLYVVDFRWLKSCWAEPECLVNAPSLQCVLWHDLLIHSTH